MKIELLIDSRVRPSRPLPQEERDELKRAFTHRNPSHKKAEKALENLPSKASGRVRAILFAKLKSEKKWIETWREDASGLSLPRGGLVQARDVLETMGHEVEVWDERCEGDPEMRHAYEHRLELRSYQEEVCDAVEEWEQGLVRSPTGSGKTTAMIAAASRTGLPTLFVVHTTKLLDQWVRRLQVELGIAHDDVGIIGDGKKRIRPVTVATQQSAAKMVDYLAPLFGYVVCDEVHLFAAATFLAFVDKMPARFRVGVSDDERRKDRKEFLLHDVFGQVIEQVERRELVNAGTIFDVDVRIFRTGYDPPWWRDIPEQERPSHWLRLLEDMGKNDARNRQIEAVALEEARRDERVLLWAEHVEHCERLHADIAARDPRVGLLLGTKQRAAEFSRTLLGLLEGDVRIAVGTYKAVSTGLDIPLMSRGIACTPIHNNRSNLNQTRGRLCRRPDGKDSAILYYPWDEEVFGLGVVEKICRVSKGATILHDGKWVEAREWLKRERAHRKMLKTLEEEEG